MNNKSPAPGDESGSSMDFHPSQGGGALGSLGRLASSALGVEEQPYNDQVGAGYNPGSNDMSNAAGVPRLSAIGLPPSSSPARPVLVVSPKRKFELFASKLEAITVDPSGLYIDALHALCGNVVSMEGLWASKALRLLYDKISGLKSHEQKAYLFGSLYKAYAAQGYKSDQGYGNFTLHPEYAQLKADLQHVPETLLFEHRLIFWVNYLECALLAIDPHYEMDKFYHQIQEHLRPKIFSGTLNEMQKTLVMYTYGQMAAVMFHLAEQVKYPFEKIQRILLDLPEDLCRSYRIHLLTPELNGKVVSTRIVIDLERVSSIMRGNVTIGRPY